MRYSIASRETNFGCRERQTFKLKVSSLSVHCLSLQISVPFRRSCGNSRQIRETNIFPSQLASAGEASDKSDIQRHLLDSLLPEFHNSWSSDVKAASHASKLWRVPIANCGTFTRCQTAREDTDWETSPSEKITVD
ncbi:hypothetical protein TNIN_395641 [Trichonephila inaurata madagascariensis]|uniref:Uncharacterized protein n=1 Tax=Trichonephila inaurata madagascariensis TaxID=2747483 RepID=A0A8X6YFF0_9ARAC|nr:hypothetical protein TNIN_395641 [Trichonephila inaurata madagascariensis]